MFDHVAIAVSDLAASERFYRTVLSVLGVEPGHADADPDGNSVEAVHYDRKHAVPDGRVDHLWIRVRDPRASRRFYTTIAPHAGLRLTHDEPDRVQLSGPDHSFSLVRDERPLTEHVHLAYGAFVLDPDGHNVEAVNHDGS